MAAGASINADMPAAIPIPTLSLSASSSTPAAGVMGSGAESAAGSVAAANKLAGESRRTEDAARTRRKIGDLEISNTSLLQINQTLEATVRKQAAEIQELKQRIQTSSQFGNGYTLIPDNTPSQDKDVSSEIIPENNTPKPKSVITNETAVIILELTEAERQADLTFKRLCATIEQMMFEARQALDQSMRPAGVKVLSSYDMHEKDKLGEDDLDLADQPINLDDDTDKSLDLSIPVMEDDDQDLNDASTLGTDSTLG
ncbi:hypothetical protein BGZ67_000353 [Mortierella alpina]|nr:hypothetical protein BGZ67_000353 [Mortierella alpina]